MAHFKRSPSERPLLSLTSVQSKYVKGSKRFQSVLFNRNTKAINVGAPSKATGEGGCQRHAVARLWLRLNESSSQREMPVIILSNL